MDEVVVLVLSVLVLVVELSVPDPTPERDLVLIVPVVVVEELDGGGAAGILGPNGRINAMRTRIIAIRTIVV